MQELSLAFQLLRNIYSRVIQNVRQVIAPIMKSFYNGRPCTTSSVRLHYTIFWWFVAKSKYYIISPCLALELSIMKFLCLHPAKYDIRCHLYIRLNSSKLKSFSWWAIIMDPVKISPWISTLFNFLYNKPVQSYKRK